MAFNLAALFISIVALTVSGVIAFGQLRTTQRANTLAIIFEGFKETRSPEFLRSIEYVLYKLRDDHPTAIPFLNLPEVAKEHVRRVGLCYDDLGKLVAYGVVDKDLILGTYGRSIHRAWKVLAPYAYREREARQRLAMIHFEDIAARASGTTPQDIHRRLGMRRLPPENQMSE